MHQMKPVHEGARPGRTNAQQRPTSLGLWHAWRFQLVLTVAPMLHAMPAASIGNTRALKHRPCGARA